MYYDDVSCVYTQQGSFQLLVRVNDEDGFSPDDLIDRVIINTSLAAGSSLPVQNYTGLHNVATLEMEVTVQCDPNFFGDDCTRRCEPRDDSSGHFECDSNGNIVCLPGWMDTATNCTTCKYYNINTIISYVWVIALESLQQQGHLHCLCVTQKLGPWVNLA